VHGYVNIINTTRRRLDDWTDPAREKRFFCQIEKLETTIYLTEVARKYDPVDRERAARRQRERRNVMKGRASGSTGRWP
jgi:type III restriction enzyme